MRVNETSPKTIQSIARAFTRKDCPLTTIEIAARLNTTNKLISKLLRRGIAEGILDRPTCELIYHKIVHSARGSRKAILAMDEAFEQRDLLIKEKFSLRENLNEKIKSLKHQLASYDEFFFEEEGAPSLQYLENELEKALDELAEVEDLLKSVL